MPFRPPFLQSAAIVLRSIRYYKPKQLVFWIWYSLRRRLPQMLRLQLPRVPDSPNWHPLDFRVPIPSNPYTITDGIGEGRFTFLNETRDLDLEVDWRPRGVGRLWIYNLHYFDYLEGAVSSDPDRAWSLLKRWIARNPPGTPDAWDPYPLSLRIANWIQVISNEKANQGPPPEAIRSLYQQCLWLEKSLEWHLLANHLFKNAKALILAGLFFHGTKAERWLKLGLSLLENEIHEQVLPDGSHFERSPMYHTMILKDCLDLLNIRFPSHYALAGSLTLRWEAFREKLQDTVFRMISFLSGMTHPDGRIALFNDAAFGVELDPDHIHTYAEQVTSRSPGIGSFPAIDFPDSGYFIMNPYSGDYLVVDCGPLGPDYQPGHAHCDTLSFELSLKGRRVIVDSGCYEYQPGRMRDYNRGNEGHNTLTIDGQNQSEVWAAHRCGRRARPIYGRLRRCADGTIIFEGAHDGYRRLRGHPIHHRRVWWKESLITVEDTVEGRGRHFIESRLHIHPDLSVTLKGNQVLLRSDSEKVLLISPLRSGNLEVTQGWYCPEFGLKLACPVIKIKHGSTPLPFRSGWSLKILN